MSFERLATPYTLWMVDRCRAAYATLPPAERRAVDGALAGTGCEVLLAYPQGHRVARRPFRLFLASALRDAS